MAVLRATVNCLFCRGELDILELRDASCVRLIVGWLLS